MKTENIVTLTMNPAIDMGVSVKQMMTEHKMRCLKTRRDPGGGGINVARVLKRFGAEPLAIFPMGGPSGHMLERLVAAEEVRHQSFMIARDCRANFTANELSTGVQYRFVLPGPTLGEEEWTAGLGLMTAAASSGYAVASGSIPRGVPHDFYARLARNLRVSGGARLVLDTSGPPLKHALEMGCYLVKPSLSEFTEFLGEGAPDHGACHAAGKNLVTNGKAEIVAPTMGPAGAMLISRDISIYAKPPPVQVRGTVGAGDSFLALLVLSLAQRQPLKEAFRMAIAGGCAALLSPGTGLASPDVVKQLAPQVEIETL
jgi:6-phosphofructokinase 2